MVVSIWNRGLKKQAKQNLEKRLSHNCRENPPLGKKKQ